MAPGRGGGPQCHRLVPVWADAAACVCRKRVEPLQSRGRGRGRGVHRRWRDDGHERPSERSCARMKGRPSWQLLLIGQSRFPADQTHMQCGLNGGERATSTVAGAGEAAGREERSRQARGWSHSAGHRLSVTEGQKTPAVTPDSNTNTQTPPRVPVRGRRSTAQCRKSLFKTGDMMCCHIRPTSAPQRFGWV